MEYVKQLSQTTLLTRGVLIKAVIPNHLNSQLPYFKEVREKIITDIRTISSRYDFDEKLVIYVFLCLWHSDMVKDIEFANAYETKWLKKTSKCVKDYYEEIKEYQERLM